MGLRDGVHNIEMLPLVTEHVTRVQLRRCVCDTLWLEGALCIGWELCAHGLRVTVSVAVCLCDYVFVRGSRRLTASGWHGCVRMASVWLCVALCELTASWVETAVMDVWDCVRL